MKGFRVHRRRFAVAGLLLVATFATTAYSACPKFLMFDGVDMRSQNTAAQASYWGTDIGVDGFLLNNLMSSWSNDVGAGPQVSLWQEARQFQETYAKTGAADNFVKVAIYNVVDWDDAATEAQIIENFMHAAAMARYVGFKGVALDLEPYVRIWNLDGSPSQNKELSANVYQEGYTIGTEMRQAYPAMTLVLIKDVLNPQLPAGEYALAISFFKGLLSAGFAHVVIATERTYYPVDIPAAVAQTKQEYATFVADNGLPQTDITVAPGLWPLGFSYSNKSSRMTPEEFEDELKAAFAAAPDYVWIYGFGSAWQTDGPYGKGPVASNFQDYVNVIHRVKQECLAAQIETEAASKSGARPQSNARPAAADPPAGGGGGFGPVWLMVLFVFLLAGIPGRKASRTDGAPRRNREAK